jgi:hypothetical protein
VEVDRESALVVEMEAKVDCDEDEVRVEFE